MFSLSSRGIAKRLVRNKQSTPTPYRISRLPLSRSGYTTSMSVLFDCSLLRTFEIGDFRERIKQETLLFANLVTYYILSKFQPQKLFPPFCNKETKEKSPLSML